MESRTPAIIDLALFGGCDPTGGDAVPGEHIELDVDDPRRVERKPA